MRAYLIFALVMPAAMAAAAPQAPPATPGKLACEDHAIMAAAKDKAAGIRPLNQQPGARPLLAVVRVIDGCNKPMPVNERLGFKRP
ncbi:MAG: hypothetical protein B7Y43_04275 [Sphingomonas sp. 28-62-20]|uniref:hypothetical protein n=1 Tax=Sphingomonas sp. 28-62-20 TaxID=1970433 RepID=UPI000BD64799|nr:MAG: hypothetical protein B7Y43_04275 [Sphingomonas sp. 28-62-20]